MRCDLHVHTRHSGMCTVPLLDRVCRESYNDPDSVYETLKHRGMDLVTITDHDSIDAAESLCKYPDFFLSEEVSAVSPSGTKLHIGVYDIRERHHSEIQRRRDDLLSLVAYLGEQRLFYTINHVYSSLTGPRTEADFAFFARYFPGIEALNGQIPEVCNRRASDLAATLGKGVMGGSDAHTMAALGRTYTEVSGARNKDEFVSGLGSGQASLHGESGNYWKLTGAVIGLASKMMRERPWTLSLSPLFPLVPAVTLANYFRELAFVYQWSSRTRYQTSASVCAAGWRNPQESTEAVMTFSRAAASLSAPDYFLMHRVNRWRPPRWFRVWMLAATRAGDGWLWWCCGIAVESSGNVAKDHALAAAALAVVSGIVAFKILKHAVGRKRPCAITPHCWANLLPPDQFSFPSGHSITAFAVAVSLGTFYPPALPVLLFCATSVAASRVLLGMHFLTDVLAGSSLGAALGYAAALLLGA